MIYLFLKNIKMPEHWIELGLPLLPYKTRNQGYEIVIKLWNSYKKKL